MKDDVLKFFLALEQQRINKINEQRLSSLQHDLVDDSIAEVLKNATLKTAFTTLFNIDANTNKVNLVYKLSNHLLNEGRLVKFLCQLDLSDFMTNTLIRMILFL